MGIYIRPTNMTNLEFVQKYGHALADHEAAVWDAERRRDRVLICVSYHGETAVAGIAYSNQERDRFVRDMIGRRHHWCWVAVDHIGVDAGLPEEFPEKFRSDPEYWGLE